MFNQIKKVHTRKKSFENLLNGKWYKQTDNVVGVCDNKCAVAIYFFFICYFIAVIFTWCVCLWLCVWNQPSGESIKG